MDPHPSATRPPITSLYPTCTLPCAVLVPVFVLVTEAVDGALPPTGLIVVLVPGVAVAVPVDWTGTSPVAANTKGSELHLTDKRDKRDGDGERLYRSRK
jgi:hypothetical protein